MNPIDKIGNLECIDAFAEMIRRAVTMDFMLSRKMLSKDQLKILLDEKPEIQERTGHAIPLTIGLLLKAYTTLNKSERAALIRTHVPCGDDYLDHLHRGGRHVEYDSFDEAILDPSSQNMARGSEGCDHGDGQD